MEMLSSKQKTAIIIAGVIVVGIFIFYMTTKTRDYDYSVINEAIEDETNDKENEEKVEENISEIIIHVTGAVKNEGIVKIKQGDRIVDAIEAAGGLTSEADLTAINLAYALQDGQKIYIPKITDTEEEIAEIEEQKVNVVIDNGESKNTTGKLNINKATIEELMSLSGIGEATAMKIVEYRTTNGNFKTIEDIKNVSGIGNAKYESIKDYICVK